MTWLRLAVARTALAAAALPAMGYGAGTPAPYLGSYVLPARVSAAQLARLPLATTYSWLRRAPRDPDPYDATAGIVAHVLSRRVVYAAPGRPPIAILPARELGGPTWVPVVSRRPRWVRVLLPSRPNHATGWLFTGNGLSFRYTPYTIWVQITRRRLSVVDGGRTLGTWTIAVGAPSTPTPTGRTFLLASLAPVRPTSSRLILPLGTHSATLDTFGGGPGTVALHGWPDPRVFGRAVSHGCVRVPQGALRVLSRIPLGSLVLIAK